MPFVVRQNGVRAVVERLLWPDVADVPVPVRSLLKPASGSDASEWGVAARAAPAPVGMAAADAPGGGGAGERPRDWSFNMSVVYPS